MKKLLLWVLALALLTASLVPAMAEDLGVQVIGGEVAATAISLDDMQLGETYRIDGYADVIPMSFDYYDCFAQYHLDFPGDNSPDHSWDNNSAFVLYDDGNYVYRNASWMDSSVDAEFAYLQLDLTNLQKTPVNFMKEMSVKVVYEDEYEYNGWVRQMDYNTKTPLYRKAHDGDYPVIELSGDLNMSCFALDPANEIPIDMVYTGHYIVGCTLPNQVVNGDGPLRMEIKLGDSDLTFHIRK